MRIDAYLREFVNHGFSDGTHGVYARLDGPFDLGDMGPIDMNDSERKFLATRAGAIFYPEGVTYFGTPDGYDAAWSAIVD